MASADSSRVAGGEGGYGATPANRVTNWRGALMNSPLRQDKDAASGVVGRKAVAEPSKSWSTTNRELRSVPSSAIVTRPRLFQVDRLSNLWFTPYREENS